MSDQIQINGLDDLISQLGNLTLSEQVKKEAIQGAADIYGNALINNVQEVVTPTKGKKTHLWEDVSYQKDQYPDGSVDVGFNKYGYYYRFVNNGTKYHPGKHFMEHTYDQVSDKMEQAIVDRVMKGDK